MRTLSTLCALLLFASGCVIPVGSRAEDIAVGRSPAGSDVTLELRTGGLVNGELLAVGDSAVMVLSSGRVTLVQYPLLQRIVIPDRRISMPGGTRPDMDTLRELELLARFPQGVDDKLLARLLAQQGQPTLLVIGR